MYPIQIKVTDRLGDEPRIFSTRDGGDGVELRLAADIPARNGDNVTRWVKVTAYGLLATRTVESVGPQGRPRHRPGRRLRPGDLARHRQRRARITLRAREIAASMAFDTLRTNYAARKAARAAAANGEHTTSGT